MKIKAILLLTTVFYLSCSKDNSVNLPNPAEAVVGYYNVFVNDTNNKKNLVGNVAISKTNDNTVQLIFVNCFNSICSTVYANVNNNSSNNGRVDINLISQSIGTGSIILTGSGFYVNNSIQIPLTEIWNGTPVTSFLVGSK